MTDGATYQVRVVADPQLLHKAVTLNVVDRIAQGGTVKWAITLAGKETRTVTIPTTQDWYDLGITLVGESYFYQSLVGHVEGRDGVSRPSLLRWS